VIVCPEVELALLIHFRTMKRKSLPDFIEKAFLFHNVVIVCPEVELALLIHFRTMKRKSLPDFIEKAFSASLVGTIGFEPMTLCL
jgi:hypothetical protein